MPTNEAAQHVGQIGAGSGTSGSCHPLACPFYKFNPRIYDTCIRYQFKRISDVKQHLSRQHSLPLHSCPECWSAFDDERSKNYHLRHDNCQSQPQPEELSPEEVKNMKGLRIKDLRNHWFAIWAQLFRGFAEPSSPYIQSQIEEFKDLIGPSFEAALHAGLPSLLHKNSEAELSSFAKVALNDACRIFYLNLPESRHAPPSPSHLQNNSNRGSSHTTSSQPSPWDENNLVNYDVGLDPEQHEYTITENADITFDYDDFEPMLD